ncbi:MAG: 30S ribosomal protein S3ae [Hadesarchaea archaeon]|nr:30S ribosomal protein S3ae [Hadesarchaea archaeon]MDH5684923.1 30S ribosomal protein S3ae [Hadesarchaea archaeon]
MEEKKRAVKKSWREKGWYDIIAPPMFGNAKIGETLASDSSQLIGRVFETTLGDLIEDFSKSHIKLYFQVKGVEEGRALTSFISHDMARDYIRSQIRRRATRISDISTVTTQDGYRLRVSAIITTLRRVQSSQLEAIRRDMRKVVAARAGERTFDQFVQEVVLGKLSADLYKEAKKYCPVKRVEVWKTKVLAGPA